MILYMGCSLVWTMTLIMRTITSTHMLKLLTVSTMTTPIRVDPTIYSLTGNREALILMRYQHRALQDGGQNTQGILD